VRLFQGNGDVMLTNSLEGIAEHYMAVHVARSAYIAVHAIGKLAATATYLAAPAFPILFAVS
jgi:hypothetical protein